MRILTWLWIAFLLLCFFVDTSTYFLARSRLADALELALDGALVAGVSEEDLRWGRNLLHRASGEKAAELLLDENLGSYFQDKVRKEISLRQVGENILAEGRLRAEFPLLLGRFLGYQGTISVFKTMRYQGSYR